MTDMTQTVKDLLDRINAAEDDDKLAYQPQLGDLIAQLHVAGKPVPADVQTLNEALLNEVIERQFDNLPI